MTQDDAIQKVVTQYTVLNPTVINAVNKRAKTMAVFKEEVFEWMEERIPTEYHEICFDNLCAAAWNYDILKPLIYDDGAISDIACHSWNNVWIQVRGKWRENDFHFRNEEHYRRFYSHVCSMNRVVSNERCASANCTDVTTCSDFRMRLNFIHKSINTDGSNIFSIRKIPTHKKTLETLCEPQEGMLQPDMLPILRKHIAEATGVLIVGMGGSGKTTFLNALIEELPLEWKILFIQENEELFSDTHRNTDFLKTVRPQNKYDVSHDLKELARNGLLMSIKCFVIGETKGEEARYMFNVSNTGAVCLTTLHSDSSVHGLDKMADYIKMDSDYSKDQCMEMLTIFNKVFFLSGYRLREVTTIKGYDMEKHQLICSTEYYNQEGDVCNGGSQST